MAKTFAGLIRDPYGEPLAGAAIRFDAVRTTVNVLEHTSAEAFTDAGGRYSIEVQEGVYNIRVQAGSAYFNVAKNIRVTEDTTAGTINELIVASQGEEAARGVELAVVAVTGDYNDLINKPTGDIGGGGTGSTNVVGGYLFEITDPQQNDVISFNGGKFVNRNQRSLVDGGNF